MCSRVQVTTYCTFPEMLQSLWLWTARLLAEMKSFPSASLGGMIEFRERVWSNPYDSGDCLLTPLPLEYDTWFCKKYRARFLFIHYEYSILIKTDIVLFWEFDLTSGVFFLIKDFSVADTSHTWKQILADSIQGECTRAARCLATWSSLFEKTLRPMLIWRSQLLVSKCRGYRAQVTEAEYSK
jgi:hypothetical protein